MFGTPYVVRLFAGFGAPEDPAMGVDYAGVVEDVGASVQRFAVGDRVVGAGNGSFAELVRGRAEGTIVKIAPNVTFDQAAGLPIAATTALQALRDKAHLRPGQRVLINGASGGVGTAAVQLAKAMGAHVTGVCSGRNVAMVRSLGADEVIDYTQKDFTLGAERYDVVIDIVGNHSITETLQVLEQGGVLVTVGDADIGAWIGPFVGMIDSSWASLFTDQRIEGLLAKLNTEDLQLLADYAAKGQLTTHVDRRYPLSDAVEAMRYFQQGRTRGKVILDASP
jgi:NADPH:quinone reductase-like Zn-dependent oxidoreductase